MLGGLVPIQELDIDDLEICESTQKAEVEVHDGSRLKSLKVIMAKTKRKCTTSNGRIFNCADHLGKPLS